MSHQPADVAVVICTRNRPAELERCLASVAALQPPAREIIVVNSAGASARDIASRYGARYLEESLPGVSRARNAGAAAATAELIAFLDDDSVATSNWLAMLGPPFADPKVMVSVGNVAPLVENSGGHHPFPLRPDPLVVDRATPGWFWLANSGRIGLGGNMMLRRSAFAKWPGFDLRLGRGAAIPGAEEHFAFFQLIELGFRCVFVPGALVRHPGLPSDEVRQHFEEQMVEIAAGYLTLLFMEHPPYRGELLRRVWRRALAGSSAGTASGVAHERPSFWKRLRAAATGFWRYWRTRAGLRA